MSRDTLLAADALVNLALGGLLLVFPEPLVDALGVPPAESAFYPSILGGVLIGIGGALLVERARPSTAGRGLGLAGAVVINLCGGMVLAGWLLFADLALPPRGSLLLWLLVALLVGLSLLELVRSRRSRG